MTPKERNTRRRIVYHLHKAMRTAALRPMGWGVDDCAMFHANVELAVTGRDLMPHLRGRYYTEEGIKQILGAGGIARGVAQYFSRKVGWKRIDPKKAFVGDFGLFVGTYQGKPGVSVVRCLHRGEWVGRNDRGWSIIATEDIRIAWRFTLP